MWGTILLQPFFFVKKGNINSDKALKKGPFHGWRSSRSLLYCFDVAVLEFTTGLKSNFTASYTHTDETTAKAKLKNRKIKTPLQRQSNRLGFAQNIWSVKYFLMFAAFFLQSKYWVQTRNNFGEGWTIGFTFYQTNNSIWLWESFVQMLHNQTWAHDILFRLSWLGFFCTNSLLLILSWKLKSYNHSCSIFM